VEVWIFSETPGFQKFQEVGVQRTKGVKGKLWLILAYTGIFSRRVVMG